MINDINTEEKILEAARKVFIEKGFDGARMQEISDSAGINKAMLHYYFRSKDKLFLKIFEAAFKQFVPKMSGIFSAEISLMDKIQLFISGYIDLLDKNPYIPLFILREITRNPNVIKELVFDKIEIIYNAIDMNVKAEIQAGRIRDIDTKHLILNTISMCIFPFVGKPLLKHLFNTNDEEYRAMLLERKKVVFEVIQKWLTP
ncbi:MAG: TetR/AcrR family transcriptional regulator [Candidatus Kapabacteria bacterium]|nr:TetR/AcrR family transcriptional regulator [Candidatus Kapabacteria bacterium]